MTAFRLIALLLVAGPAWADIRPAAPPLPPPRPDTTSPVEHPPATVPQPAPRPEEFGPPAPSPRPMPPSGSALASEVPLPVPRPEEFGPPPPPSAAPLSGSDARLGPEEFGPPLPRPVVSAPAWPGTVPSADELEQTCNRILASGKILASRVPAVTGPNGCGIEAPLMLRTILLEGGHPVAVDPPALLRCDLAEQLANWVRDDIVPIAAGRGEILALADAAAYVCRGRNNVLGAQMSEHGRGDAIDVLAFRFTGGVVGLQQADASSFWSAVKGPTCARFHTVLGPGSDGYHENNLHIDLENRRNGSHYCHWDHP